jgi:uncharacterized protein (TIGR03067 family)
MNRRVGRYLGAVLAAALAACTLGCAMTFVAKRATLHDRLQGKWTFDPKGNEFGIQTITITGNELDARTSQGDYFKCTFVLNDTVSPAQVDIKVTASSMVDAVGEMAPAIVKMEDGTATFCIDPASGYGRPREFDSRQGMLLVGQKQ